MNEFDVRLKKIGRIPIGNLLERIKKHDRRYTTIIWLYLMHKRILVIPC